MTTQDWVLLSNIAVYTAMFVLVLAMGHGPPPGMAPVTIGTQVTFLGLGLAVSTMLLMWSTTWIVSGGPPG